MRIKQDIGELLIKCHSSCALNKSEALWKRIVSDQIIRNCIIIQMYKGTKLRAALLLGSLNYEHCKVEHSTVLS